MILNIILFIIIIFITYLLILSLKKINQYEDFILQYNIKKWCVFKSQICLIK